MFVYLAFGNRALRLGRDCRGREKDLRVKIPRTLVGAFNKAVLTPFLLFTQQLGVSHLEAGGTEGCYWLSTGQQLFPFVSRCWSSAGLFQNDQRICYCFKLFCNLKILKLEAILQASTMLASKTQELIRDRGHLGCIRYSISAL